MLGSIVLRRPTFERAAYRARQAFRAVRASPLAPLPAVIAATLTVEQAAAFAALPAADQAHLLRVHALVVRAGAASPDLQVAALLHDLGKQYGRRRVHLIDRVVRVLLRQVSPALLARLARWPAARWRAGLALAVHHPVLGAERAAALGCSERACWLIAHHEDGHSHGDAELGVLIWADHAAG